MRRLWNDTQKPSYKQKFNILNTIVKHELETYTFEIYQNYLANLEANDPNM